MDNRKAIPADVRKVVHWLLVAFMAAQLIIVPWRYWMGPSVILSNSFGSVHTNYGPVWSPPIPTARILVGRLGLQVAGTGVLLVLWLAKTQPGDQPPVP